MTGNLHEGLCMYVCTCMIISRSVLLRMRMRQTRVLEKIKTRIFYQVFFIYPTECTTRLFYIKTYIEIYIGMLPHVSVNKPSSGSLLPCFAKVTIIKIVS
jgi:hypothetical protein